jgi:ADP-heptose:LPS heptosyltransferase/glycosyltransferase involved in cell wall biosynthesis
VRILAVTNIYPPDGQSGYPLGCRRTVESLEARGHEVRVLTSSPRPSKTTGDGRVLRRLARDAEDSPSWQKAFLKELVNQSAFRMVRGDFRPDVVLAFDLSGISVSLACLARESGLPVVFYVASDWLATWERDIWYRAWPRAKAGFKVLRFLSCRFKLSPVSRPLDSGHAVFASRHLESMTRQAGKTWARAAVVPWGIDTRRFSYRGPAGAAPNRLLYAGRVGPQKGVDVAIRALGRLRQDGGANALFLTIAGDEEAMPEYTAYLRDLASSCGVLQRLTFAGFVPPANMPDLYRAHDIFVFPSAVVEPLSVSVLEAMACGLGVVATVTGGNAEFLEDGVNGLVIPGENPERCAEQVLRLVRSPQLLELLGSRARSTVEKNYSLEASLSSLEDFLREAVRDSGHDRPGTAAGERPAANRGGCSPIVTPSPSLDKLVARANRWLRWGGLIVLARNLARPRTFFRALKKVGRDSSAFVSLLIFPILYEAIFGLAGRRRAVSPVDAPPPRHVLIVQLADLGDVVLSGPFLRELRRHLGGAKISLAVQPGLMNVVERCPHVDEVLPFDWRAVKGWRTAFRGALGWWWISFCTARRCLWKRHFDLAVSLRRNNDPCQAASLILAYTSGAPRRIAYLDGRDDFKLDSLRYVDRLISDGPVRGAVKHEVEYQMDILRHLGAQTENSCLETWTDPDDESFARAVLAGPGLTDGGPLIALAPGARWSYRRWPADRFTQLGRWLQEEFDARILIIAGRSEKPLAVKIESGLKKERTANLAGRTTLRQMAAVLKRCDLFVGIDSGPMHVATAAGVPAVGLFGPGEYERFRPWGTAHEVIRLGLTCNPCSESCRFDRALCIEGITVDQAKRVLSEKLTLILK